jgi:hypothetical protein
MRTGDEIFQIEYHCECGSITPILPGIVACLGCGKELEIIAVIPDEKTAE